MKGLIIEGADGTGKTTLAKIVAAKFGWDICHCTAEDPADFDFYKQTVRKKNIIWDRHTIGELIYPYVFDRKAKIGTEDARIVLNTAKQNNIGIIVLTANLDDIKSRLIKRGNECKEVLDNLEWINDQFKFYANAYHLPIIDTSRAINYDELFRWLEKDFT